MCCHEIPWSHTEESPVEVRFAVAEEPGWAAPSITQHCAAFCGSETMGRCWGERQATWTWHRKLLKLHKTNCWALAFPPYWKTISTVIKGELNRLISSKVTEQPPLSSPFPSSFSPSSLYSHLPREVEAINEMPSDLLGVRGHRTKMFCWMCSVAVWKERLRVLFCSDRWKAVRRKRYILVFKQITFFKVPPYSSTDVGAF